MMEHYSPQRQDLITVVISGAPTQIPFHPTVLFAPWLPFAAGTEGVKAFGHTPLRPRRVSAANQQLGKGQTLSQRLASDRIHIFVIAIHSPSHSPASCNVLRNRPYKGARIFISPSIFVGCALISLPSSSLEVPRYYKELMYYKD
uniref:Uncharacterized protein n=1 Tax=Anopheles culicifacies TaxID=139723 RepID=A0A182MSU6_9DIPT